MESSPTAPRYTKEALRAVRFMNEPQAADYLGAKSDALRFADKERQPHAVDEAVPGRKVRPARLWAPFKREKARRG